MTSNVILKMSTLTLHLHNRGATSVELFHVNVCRWRNL
jgi:hypothetical protein